MCIIDMDQVSLKLIEDLKAPIKSFRLFAIEEAIKDGASRDVLFALTELEKNETDAECRLLAGYAITAVKARIEGKADLTLKIDNEKEFLKAWNEADPNRRFEILSNLPARMPRFLKPLGPKLLAEEKSPLVAGKIMRVFCRFWPRDQFNEIARHVFSESLSLQLAALRTLVHMSPALLLPSLPTLLDSPNPRIKALAIRGLAKLDQDEASNHLQALLLSPDKDDRLAGIISCPFLPFETVKGLLFKFFAAETDPDLLKRAGWIVEMNPDVRVPFQLWEIAERAGSEKALLIKKIIAEVVSHLEKSDILGDGFQAYIAKLQDLAKKRNAVRFVKQWIAGLPADAAAAIPEQLELNLKKHIGSPHVRTAFREALEWPVPEHAKSYIRNCLSKGVPGEPEPSTPLEEKKPETVASQKQQKKPTEPPDSGKAAVLADRSVDAEKKLEILNEAIASSTPGLSEVCIALLNHSNMELVSAAITWLGENDPDKVFPFLGRCLKMPDVSVKSAALSVLKRFDFSQAISALRTMLSSRMRDQKRMALICMDRFDFSLTRDILTDFLVANQDKELLNLGLCLFAASPEPENIYSIYCVEKSIPQPMSIEAKTVRQKCEKSLIESGLAKSQLAEFREQNLEMRWSDDQKKKKAAKPDYAYRKAGEEQSFSGQAASLFQAITEAIREKAAVLTVVMVIVVSFSAWLLLAPPDTAAKHSDQASALIARPITVKGVIVLNENGVLTLNAQDESKFIITPGREGFNEPKVGEHVVAVLVPYRRLSSGRIQARIRSIKSD